MGKLIPPYLWGGTSGKGMDCSGFTKEVYFRNGMILSRDASQQVRAGEEIETDTSYGLSLYILCLENYAQQLPSFPV